MVVASVMALVSVSYFLSREVKVHGGELLSRAGGGLVVRCLSPEVTLEATGQSGGITFTNCFPNSVLTGFEGTVQRNDTTLSFVTSSGGTYRLKAQERQDFSFAVMGDSQGHNEVLAAALNKSTGCDFIIHCGDLTASGTRAEYAAVELALNESRIPVMTTRGNHDVKNEGAKEYEARFGPAQYWFDYGGVRFAVVDSSDLDISTAEIAWLNDALAGATRTVIVTHAPSFDPIEGNHTLDNASCVRLKEFAASHHVTAVLSGHIHAFNATLIGDTEFVITGGAGGSLTAGEHHIVRVNVTDSSLVPKELLIVQNFTVPTALKLVGKTGTTNLTMEDIIEMQKSEGDSSFQNQFGNVRGQGHYLGVAISALVDLVGGIQEGDILTVSATDGYSQTFGYGNVYPNTTWLDLQGIMIFAYEYNGTAAPAWADGPRLVMLPSDGYYSNSDCQLTSYPGQGFSIADSAGARWVRNVQTLTVEVAG